jgi:hypothetical protein
MYVVKLDAMVCEHSAELNVNLSVTLWSGIEAGDRTNGLQIPCKIH